MDTQWFQDSLARVGYTQADLSRHLQLAPSAVSRMMRGERQMKLQEAVQIAAFLGVPQDEVLRRAGTETIAPAEPARRGRPPRRDAAPFARAPSHDRIPIRGTTAGQSADQPIGSTPRPANLTDVREAYAIYMPGDGLSPRYEPGWLLYVHPFKPPTRGRDVVVYTKDQRVLIKQFVSWNDEALVLRQLNPEEMLRVPSDEVVECHLIVGVDQEG